jgi:predicted lipoprotein with Yx(FWY)xxD motif
MHIRSNSRVNIPAALAISASLALVLTGCAGSSAATSSGGGSPVVIKTTSVPGVGSVLVDPSGMTLYVLPTETASHITCTGTCATVWPPFLLPAGTTGATAGSGVHGTFGTVTRPGGGTQITFDGSPLYTFQGDVAGQAKGQNVEDFVAAPASGTGGSGSGSSPASGGGYGGY